MVISFESSPGLKVTVPDGKMFPKSNPSALSLPGIITTFQLTLFVVVELPERLMVKVKGVVFSSPSILLALLAAIPRPVVC